MSAPAADPASDGVVPAARAASGTTAVPPVETLRPSLLRVLLRAALYLIRNAVLCALVAVLVVQPLHRRFLALPGVRALGPVETLVVVFPIMSHAVPWVVFNGAFAFMDSLLPETGHSPLLRFAAVRAAGQQLARSKLPRRRTQQPSAKLVKRTVTEALINNWIVTPIVTYVLLCRLDPARLPARDRAIAGFGPADAHSASCTSTLAAFLVVVAHFMLANIMNEVGFFAVHGSLHASPTLYRVLHKQHHEYVGTISIAAEHAGLVERILANLIPSIGYFLYAFFGAGPNAGAFLQAARAGPLLVTWMWARLWETYETHSGFSFAETWLGRVGLLHGKRSRFHDFHHTHNVGNYGTGLFMDALLGTMDPYLRHRYGVRQAAVKSD